MFKQTVIGDDRNMLKHITLHDMKRSTANHPLYMYIKMSLSGQL